MCDRVNQRIECPECGYPYSEAMYSMTEFPDVQHTVDCVDCIGRALYVGDYVVYNQSGALVRGHIKKITHANNYVARNHPSQRHLQYIVHIDDSIVRNTQGIYKLHSSGRYDISQTNLGSL